MKYLTNFKTKEEYNSFKDSSNYIYPNISYIEDSGSVINKSPQIQEKQIEITENGEITITPDAGFAYLNSVKVKTNVAQSGGGGSASSMEYWDVTALPAATFELGYYALLVKFRYKSNLYVRSSIELIDKLTEDYETSLFAVALDKNIKMMEVGSVTTVGEIFESKGFPDFTSLGWKQITEEEFYNLNA